MTFGAGGARAGLLAVAVLSLVLPVAVRAQDPVPEERAPVAYAIVLASTLNVRADRGLDAAVVGSVSRGDTVCVVRLRDDWAEVRARRSADGDRAPLSGFAARAFLSERRTSADALTAMGCG